MAELYALACPYTGEYRYIGKANNCAARLKSHLRDAMKRNTPVYAWMRKLIKDGAKPEMIHLCTSLDGNWQQIEQQLIAQYRDEGARLLNVANGGDEPFCPVSVRAENGKKVAGSRDKKRWALLRRVGGESRWLEQHGRKDAAERLRQCSAIIKILPDDLINRLYSRFC